MTRWLLLIFLFCLFSKVARTQSPEFSSSEIEQWKRQADRIKIYRDSYGVPHIYGNTDADAVFGLLYAQCEDGFDRVEMNYITALGRQSEIKGEAFLWHDLRARLIIDEARAKDLYTKTNPALKSLINAFASGVNYFLYTHPEVSPKLIKRFEPWMHLMFSEGSIGGDITSISLSDLERFYTGGQKLGFYAEDQKDLGQTDGSNGFALSPQRTLTGNTLFYINPHTTFYFRGEFHVNSMQGLNAYGAATWGQMFLYQGFNAYCGWMHTSSQADVIDFYQEKIDLDSKGYGFWYDGKRYPVESKEISIFVLVNGQLEKRNFTGYRTIHGPVVAQQNGSWISVSMMDLPIEALTQSFYRTKATGYEGYRKTMDIRTNSSNNTVFADYQGNIAYWHGNFMPKRDPKIDSRGIIDGSISSTAWTGLHEQTEMMHLLNPDEGWIQNCNSNPFTATGKGGLDSLRYPYYMAPDEENYRGIHARKLFSGREKFSAEQLVRAAFDSYLPGFEKIIPSVVSAFEKNKSLLNPALSGPVELLRNWDFRSGVDSKAMTLAMVMSRKLQTAVTQKTQGALLENIAMVHAMATELSELDRLICLNDAVQELTNKFGTWEVKWGDLNRFQRPQGLENIFYDRNESLAVGLGSGFYGALATFESRSFGTDKWYGVSGNSFVAVVEFGKKVKAKSILVGGQDCRLDSKHFNDQAEGYVSGTFKDVLFYKQDVVKNAQRSYKPGLRSEK